MILCSELFAPEKKMIKALLNNSYSFCIFDSVFNEILNKLKI